MLNKEYWTLFFMKIIETMISVKVWVIFSIMYLSTWLLINQFIEGGVWGTVNTAVISTVLAVREGFKISRVRKEDEIASRECHNNPPRGEGGYEGDERIMRTVSDIHRTVPFTSPRGRFI